MNVIVCGLVSSLLAVAASDPVITLTPRPLTTIGAQQTQIRLDGRWQFRIGATEEGGASGDLGVKWREIDVPGHWVTQGIDVPSNTAATYRRAFTLPRDWTGGRIKLRFDGVYSDVRVSLNGKAVGRHVGGFTPFEFDVTDLVHSDRENSLTVQVQRESPADLLMTTFGTLYDKTPLGGMTRKVTLFVVPEVHVSRLHLQTTFSPGYRDAKLHVDVAVSNAGDAPTEATVAAFSLVDPNGQNVPISPSQVDLGSLQPGKSETRQLTIPVSSPAKWDCEHPNLYTLTCQVRRGKAFVETVRQRFGFRQVEVSGRRLLVNGQPVKLRGVCRHEMDAATGRVNSPALSRRDVELFRAANINLIRTSHYPPAEELLDACDELGMFVEEEAPFHHAQPIDTPEYRHLFLQQTAEMIERDRNRPSVIIWSLGNESDWSPNFVASAEMVKRLDPSRPRLFAEGYAHFKKYPQDDIYRSLEIASWHYPGMATVDRRSSETTKPLLFDEYCHGNCYNREEIATDPGLRDEWEASLEEIWERMQANEGCLGGAIWGGIDEVWHLPDGSERGWGRWGLLDSWHRLKPEYWHAKKVYSPVRARLRQMPKAGSDEPFRVTVENRHDFTDLGEVKIVWSLGRQSGQAQLAAAPHTTAELEIRPDVAPQAGESFRLEFHSPRGFLIDVDQWAIRATEPVTAKQEKKTPSSTPRLMQNDESTVVETTNCSWTFDVASGMIRSARVQVNEVVCGGPVLMLLPIGGNTAKQTHQANLPPWTQTCTDWQAESVTAKTTELGVELQVAGKYREADGSFRMLIDGAGAMTVDYRFVARQKIAARQVGIVFDLPGTYDRLTWQRDNRWSVYPDDHIGRLAGSTTSMRDSRWESSSVDRRPTWPWAFDESPSGTNDFRATRSGIRHVSLTDEAGLGLHVYADGRQASRAWLEKGRVRLLVADFAHGTGERFLLTRGFPSAQPRVLAPGESIEGTVRVLCSDRDR